MSGFVRKKFQGFTGYVPGFQPPDLGWIKLNTNENPFPPSPKIRKFLSSVDFSLLRKYPSPMGEPLRGTLSGKYSISQEKILVTNGSDEALALLFLALFEETDTVICPSLTYSLYPVLSGIYGGKIREISVDADFQFRLEDLESADGKAIIFANPNAPTGTYFSPEEIFSMAEKSSKLWIIDEAYADFADREKSSMLDYPERLNSAKNIVVIRTFSKSYSLAGARIGYLVSPDEEIMNALYALKDSYNEDYLSLMMGELALEDFVYYENNIRIIKEQRIFMKSEMEKMGFFVFPSQANFLLIRPHSLNAGAIMERLKDKKILVRHFNTQRLANYLRISIGSPEENRGLLDALEFIINGNKLNG